MQGLRVEFEFEAARIEIGEFWGLIVILINGWLVVNLERLGKVSSMCRLQLTSGYASNFFFSRNLIWKTYFNIFGRVNNYLC